jgi:hypothetical protein
VPSTLTKGTAAGVCNAIICGQFADLVVGFWGPGAVDVIVDPYTHGTTGAVRLVVLADVGVGVVRPASFAAMQDALTA